MDDGCKPYRIHGAAFWKTKNHGFVWKNGTQEFWWWFISVTIKIITWLVFQSHMCQCAMVSKAWKKWVFLWHYDALWGIVIQPSLGGSLQWIYWSPNGWMAIPFDEKITGILWKLHAFPQWNPHRPHQIHGTFPIELMKFMSTMKITISSPWKSPFFAGEPLPPSTIIPTSEHGRTVLADDTIQEFVASEGRLQLLVRSIAAEDLVGVLHRKFGFLVEKMMVS